MLGHNLVWYHLSYFLALLLAADNWQQTKMQVRRLTEATSGKDAMRAKLCEELISRWEKDY